MKNDPNAPTTTDPKAGMQTLLDSPLTSLIISTPIGPLELIGNNTSLIEIDFATSRRTPLGSDAPEEPASVALGAQGSGWAWPPCEPASRAGLPEPRGQGGRLLSRVATQIEEYFAGDRIEFDLPLAPSGTPFQQKVWHALTTIPYGKTTTYAGLAGSLGSPKAVRAVGHANGRNPIPIIIPCHRVIGSDGTLTGYAGGLGVKRALLDLESGTPPFALPID